FECVLSLRDLHSFPTRRSSDLLSRISIQHRCPTPLRFYLERLLRLVRRGSKDRNLQRRRREEELSARGDGLRFVRNCAVAASIQDRKSTRLNSSHRTISYAVFC